MSIMAYFLAGITAAAFLASALFFFKFWRASRDRFFMLFGSACTLLAVERIILVFLSATTGAPVDSEAQATVFLARAMAYIMICVAVIQRNRAGRT